MDFQECIKQLQDNHNKLVKENCELQNFKDEAEETCESVPVVKEMEKRIESAENGMEMLIIERELCEVIDSMELSSEKQERANQLRKNKELMEWFISYMLGCKLVFDYDLVTPVVKYINGHKMVIPLIEDGEYVINENKSLGFKYDHEYKIRLCHDRFNYDAGSCDKCIYHNFNILNLFKKLYKSPSRPILRSHKGTIQYIILNKKYFSSNSMNWDDNIWEIYSEYIVDIVPGAMGTRDIIYEILSNLYI